MKTAIRQLQGDELLEIMYTLNSYSLHPSPPLYDKDEWFSIVRQRQGMNCHALFEDKTPVSVAVSTPMTQNMRGKLYPASGVWGVATFPSARRKGYCRKVMESVLSSDHDSGKAFSNLYPFRESFYERLGFVSFPLTKIARLKTLSLAPLLKMETEGEIRLQYFGEAYDAYREYLNVMREHRHGMAFFDFGDRAGANKNIFWTALAIFDGKVEGIMLYRIRGEEVTKFKFEAIRFYYRTSRARYLLLNWIARHIDQAERAELWLPEDEYPETWLADIQVKFETAIRAAMSRVLNVEKIAGMQVGEGGFSARIVDPLCPWNEGVWRFGSVDGRLEVSKASSADCGLTIQGLTALVSGVPDPQDFPLRGWGKLDSSLISTVRAIFPPLRPFMHENF
jgi:predicted acetyltransferase